MLAGVAAVHGREDAVRARLHGKVQRRHERGQRGEQPDDLVGEILRMARREAEPLDARGIHGPKDIREPRLAVKVAPVGVHVLPQQRDLLDARFRIGARLGGDVVQGPRLLAPADVGHDAVGAEIVASHGDGQPRRPVVLAHRGQGGGELRSPLNHFGGAAVLLDGASEKPRQRAQIVSAENHIEMGKRRKQLVAVALADAAAYGDVALVKGRAVAQGDVLHGGDLPVEPRVGSLADAARHEHDDVRLLDGFDGQRAQALQHAGDPLGIVLVHLAAEGVDAETSSLEDVAHSKTL